LPRSLLSGRPGRHFPFYYPPAFLLACLPLSALSLFGAYLAWLAATVALLVAALRQAGAGWAGLAVLVLSPAGILTITTGQNAFLTTAPFVLAGVSLFGGRGSWGSASGC
jgi:hypothetical protein